MINNGIVVAVGSSAFDKAPAADRRRELAFTFRRSEYLGIAAGAASGSLVFGALPFVVGAAIAAFGDPATAGIAASVELVAMGVSSVAVSAFLRFLPGRRTALLSALLLIAGQLLSGIGIARHSWSLFLAGRLLAGLGEGSLYTICNAFAAKASYPDRAFTVIAFGQTIFNALFFTIMALVNVSYDPVRTFVLFVAFPVVGMLPLFFAPVCRTIDDGDPDQHLPKAPLPSVAKIVLIGFAVYSIALYMLFPYVENIGVVAGFTHSQVAGVLALGTIIALAGPVITAGLGLRFGRLRPICVAIAFQILAAIILVYSRSLPIWGAAEIVSIAMLYVLNPLMFGLAAHVDDSGRTAAAGGAIMAITAAIGPAISSVVLSLHSSYVTLGWFNAAVYVVMVMILLNPLRSADRKVGLQPA